MRWVGLLTLAAGLALAGGYFGSSSGESIPAARFAGSAVGCPRPTGYLPQIEPSTGPVGSTVTLTGTLPLWDDPASMARPGVRALEVWWNLTPSHWLTARGGEPAPVSARPGRALRELRAMVPGATSCTYQLVFRVPRVAAGTYPVDVLYRTVVGAANLPAVAFKVTR
jgi:hypothetical protein